MLRLSTDTQQAKLKVYELRSKGQVQRDEWFAALRQVIQNAPVGGPSEPSGEENFIFSVLFLSSTFIVSPLSLIMGHSISCPYCEVSKILRHIAWILVKHLSAIQLKERKRKMKNLQFLLNSRIVKLSIKSRLNVFCLSNFAVLDMSVCFIWISDLEINLIANN